MQPNKIVDILRNNKILLFYQNFTTQVEFQLHDFKILLQTSNILLIISKFWKKVQNFTNSRKIITITLLTSISQEISLMAMTIAGHTIQLTSLCVGQKKAISKSIKCLAVSFFSFVTRTTLIYLSWQMLVGCLAYHRACRLIPECMTLGINKHIYICLLFSNFPLVWQPSGRLFAASQPYCDLQITSICLHKVNLL